jgi:hypothetical protein
MSFMVICGILAIVYIRLNKPHLTGTQLLLEFWWLHLGLGVTSVAMFLLYSSEERDW